MKASIVDLRYKTSEILKALAKNESVTISYHGKTKGIIKPVNQKLKQKVTDHPFFSMNTDNEKDPVEIVNELRKPRYAI